MKSYVPTVRRRGLPSSEVSSVLFCSTGRNTPDFSAFEKPSNCTIRSPFGLEPRPSTMNDQPATDESVIRKVSVGDSGAGLLTNGHVL